MDARGGPPVSCSSSDSSGRGPKFGYASSRIWRSCVDGQGGKMKAFGLADEGAPAVVREVPTPSPVRARFGSRCSRGKFVITIAS